LLEKLSVSRAFKLFQIFVLDVTNTLSLLFIFFFSIRIIIL